MFRGAGDVQMGDAGPVRVDERMRLLEGKHVLSILMYIRDKGSCMKTDIYNDVSQNPRSLEKVEVLESLGFVTIEPVDRKRTRITLTEKGVLVTDKLDEIRTLL